MTTPKSAFSLINVSGPYAVGKDTVLNALMSRIPEPVHRVTTITTRAVSKDSDPSYAHLAMPEFNRRTSVGNWIVNFQLNGSVAYGTSVDEILEETAKGVICFHSIFAGPHGAGMLRTHFGHKLLSIGLLPGWGDLNVQLSILENRLKDRGRDEPEVIAARLKSQMDPLQYVLKNPSISTREGHLHVFDRVLVNQDVDATVEQVFLLLYPKHIRSKNE